MFLTDSGERRGPGRVASVHRGCPVTVAALGLGLAGCGDSSGSDGGDGGDGDGGDNALTP